MRSDEGFFFFLTYCFSLLVLHMLLFELECGTHNKRWEGVGMDRLGVLGLRKGLFYMLLLSSLPPKIVFELQCCVWGRGWGETQCFMTDEGAGVCKRLCFMTDEGAQLCERLSVL